MQKRKRKKCAKCKKRSSVKNFYKDSSRGDGLNPYCLKCVRLKAKKYRLENKEKIYKYQNAWRSKLYKENLEYKIYKDFSKSLRNALNSREVNKNNKTFNLVGYTVVDLREHIESLFEPWMNWENKGRYHPETWDDNDSSTWTWHIDHIKPQSEFDFDSLDHPEFKKCWALSNLRPYSAKKNVLDGANRTRHKKKLK